MPADPVAEYLRGLNTSPRARAAAWDAVYAAKDDTDAEARLKQLPFSDAVRADLWDLRAGGTLTGPVAAPTPANSADFTEPPPQPEGSAMSRVMSNIGSNLVGIPQGLANIFLAGYGDQEAMRRLTQPQIDQFLQAVDAGKAGRTSEAAGHAAAAAIPLLGPPAAQAGEQIASGDYAGGLANAATQVALQATPGVVGRRVARSMGGADNVTQMNQALNATTRENKVRSARVAPEMVRRRIWSKDLPTLEARAVAESERAGQAVGGEVARIADQTADVLPLVERMEQAKEPYLDRANGRRIVIEAGPVDAIQQLQDTLMEYGDSISMDSLNRVRLNWDEIVQRNKGFTKDDITQLKAWAAREGRSVLREELGRQGGADFERVMAEYSFWQNIEDVSHATNQRRVGQSRGLLPTIAAGAGAIVGEAVAPGSGVGKLGAALIGGKLAASLKRLLESPGYQMWSAVNKQRLADALMSKDRSRIEASIGRGLAALTAQSGRAAATARSDESPERKTGEQAQR